MPRNLSHIPPISGRPKCKGRGKRLRPISHGVFKRVQTPTGFHEEPAGRKFYDWQGYEGFHSLRCALRFAQDAYAAGYRIKGIV